MLFVYLRSRRVCSLVSCDGRRRLGHFFIHASMQRSTSQHLFEWHRRRGCRYRRAPRSEIEVYGERNQNDAKNQSDQEFHAVLLEFARIVEILRISRYYRKAVKPAVRLGERNAPMPSLSCALR